MSLDDYVKEDIKNVRTEFKRYGHLLKNDGRDPMDSGYRP